METTVEPSACANGTAGDGVTCLSDSSLADNQLSIGDLGMRVVYVLISCVGIIGNALVFIVISNNKRMRKTYTNMYILNQCIIDFSAAVILLFSTFYEYGNRVFVTLGDDLYCRLWLTRLPLWSLFVSSTYNLIAMTLERYLGVIFPIWHRNRFGKIQMIASITSIWIFGPLLNSSYMVPTGFIDDGKCYIYIWPNSQIQTGVGITLVVVQFLIPISLHGYCYGRMAWVLTGKSDPKPSAPTKSQGDDAKARITRNIIKTLSLVTLGFILCWIWNQSIWLAFNLGATVDLNGTFYHFSVVAVFTNCCINPIVYMAKYEQFQKALKAMVCRGRVGAIGEASVSVTATTNQ